MGANASGADTLLRQWQMLRAIPRYPAKTAATALRERLENAGFAVTIRTIQRDLHELADVFPLEVDDRERPYGWRWMKDAPSFDLPNLTNQEALAFTMIRDYLRPLLPHRLVSQLDPYFAAASKRLSGEGPSRADRSWPGKVAVVQPTQTLIPPRIDAAVNAAVTDALLLDRQVRVAYRRRADAASVDYVLNPLGLVQRGPVTYVVGTLFKYDDVRLFALHRIRRATVLEEPARRPKGFSLDSYLGGGALQFGGGRRIRLEAIFDATAAEHLRETPLTDDQELTAIESDRVLLRARVTDTPQLRWWLLGFGAQVEVRAPPGLRAEFAASAAAMVRRYATPVA